VAHDDADQQRTPEPDNTAPEDGPDRSGPLVELPGMDTHVNPDNVGGIWRTQRKNKCTPHGVVVVIQGYDRRRYFETERERDKTYRAILEVLNVNPSSGDPEIHF